MIIRNSVIQNTGFVFISKIMSKLFSLFFIAYAARVLGPKDFGLYAFIGTLMVFFSSFGNFGLFPMAVREISRDRSRVEVLFNNILSLRVGIMLLLYPVLILVINILGYSKDVKYLISIAGVAAIFSAFSGSFSILYIAFERFKVSSFVSILISFLSTIFNIIALYLGYGLNGIIFISCFGSLLGAVISGSWVRKKFLKYKFSFNLSIVKDLLVKTTPFAVITFLQHATNNINILLLSKLPGPFMKETAMGYYNSSSSVCQNALMIPESFRLAALPRMSSNIENQTMVRDVIAKSTKVLFTLIIVPLTLATTFFPKEIITFIFGMEYLPSAPALTILGWAYAFHIFNIPVTLTLSASREIKRYVPWALLMFGINLILVIPLIFYYSFVGAAIAFLATKIIETLLRNYLLQRIWGIRRLEIQGSLRKILILATGIFFTLLLTCQYYKNTIGLLFLTLILYALFVYSLKEFRQKITSSVNSLRSNPDRRNWMIFF
ncbi:MAG: flippase [wastewater metagenome]|nr:flippase [Candidatus Loosdrechtia aerotolerans]